MKNSLQIESPRARIIGVKNLSLGALEKFISFLYTGHIVIMKSHIIRDLLKLAATLHEEKNCPSCSVLGTML